MGEGMYVPKGEGGGGYKIFIKEIICHHQYIDIDQEKRTAHLQWQPFFLYTFNNSLSMYFFGKLRNSVGNAIRIQPNNYTVCKGYKRIYFYEKNEAKEINLN